MTSNYYIRQHSSRGTSLLGNAFAPPQCLFSELIHLAPSSKIELQRNITAYKPLS